MGLRTLSRRQCLEFLAQESIGRVGVTLGALPAIFPVNFQLWGDDRVLFAAMANSRLATATDDAIIAFQADGFDVDRRSGWTVLAVGRSTRMRDPEALGVDRASVPEPWAVGQSGQHLMQLQLVELSGHEVD